MIDTEAVRPFDSEALTQFVLLSAELVKRYERGGMPKSILCNGCGKWTGFVGNSAAVIFGHFTADIEEYDGLMSIGTKPMRFSFLLGKCEIKCSDCGKVSRRHR